MRIGMLLIDPAIQWEIVAVLFRLSLVVCSALFGFWGYRLFTKGVYEKQGELQATFHGFKLSLRQFGPGIAFALLGLGFGTCAVFRPVTATTALRTGQSLKAIPSSTDPVTTNESSGIDPTKGTLVNPPNGLPKQTTSKDKPLTPDQQHLIEKITSLTQELQQTVQH